MERLCCRSSRSLPALSRGQPWDQCPTWSTRQTCQLRLLSNWMHKCADDTYILIPACNVQSRQVELDHVTDRAQANNLKLNRAKCTDIITSDSRRKPQFNPPPTLSDMSHKLAWQRSRCLESPYLITYQSATTSVVSSLSARSLCMH